MTSVFSRPQHFGRRHTAIRSRQGAVELSQGLHSTGFPVGYKVWPLDQFFFSPFYEKDYQFTLKEGQSRSSPTEAHLPHITTFNPRLLSRFQKWTLGPSRFA